MFTTRTLARSTLGRQARGLATNQAPSQSAANVSGTTKSSSSTLYIVGGLAVAGGAAYWYSQSPDAQATVAKAENKAEHALDAVRDKASELSHKSPIPNDNRTLAQRAEDEAAFQRNRAGSKIDPLLAPVVDSGKQVKDEAKRWFDWGGSSSSTASSKAEQAKGEAKSLVDRAAAEVERDAAAVKAKAGQVKDDVKDAGSSWLSWGSNKAEEGKQAAEAKAAEAKRAADAEAAKLKSGASSWFSWGSSKAEDGKAVVEDKANEAANRASDVANQASNKASELADRTQAALERQKRDAADALQSGADAIKDTGAEVKQTASSWWSWGSAKTAETKDEVAREAARARDDIVAGTRETKDSVVSGARQLGNDIAAEGRKVGSDVKDGVKETLLAAERATERGAQRAQKETAKL